MIREIRWNQRRALAPFLSAVLPGLGQAFTMRWGSAAAFILIFGLPFLFMKFIPRDLNLGHYLMFIFLTITYALNIIDAYGGSEKVDAPCVRSCPAHINIPGYISLIQSGRYQDCHELICRWTPLVATIGQVCHHPCEGVCTRLNIDEAVAICPLKAFVGRYAISRGLLLGGTAPSKRRDNAPRVAIIGSGPAGLTAGFFLSRLGLRPTIFERHSVIGGMLAIGIPAYRLPRDILAAEIAFIQEQGVEIKTGIAVGGDISLADLFADGFRAVFAAPGTHRESRLRVDGESKKGVMPALSFLASVNTGELASLDGDVVVVGGGNVAMDAARCALRLGAGKVTVVYRRSLLEMPANSWEVTEAEEEGINFHFLANPVAIQGGDAVESLTCVLMKLGEPDGSGRRRPIPVAGSEFSISCRYVLPAIGLAAEASFLEPAGVKLNENGLILTRKRSATHGRFVYAGGDAVTGPASVIGACAQGRQAAMDIYRSFRGSGFAFRKIAVPKSRSNFLRQLRTPRLVRHPDDRRLDFRLIHQNYEEAKALEETTRCLRCDKNM